MWNFKPVEGKGLGETLGENTVGRGRSTSTVPVESHCMLAKGPPRPPQGRLSTMSFLKLTLRSLHFSIWEPQVLSTFAEELGTLWTRNQSILACSWPRELIYQCEEARGPE